MSYKLLRETVTINITQRMRHYDICSRIYLNLTIKLLIIYCVTMYLVSSECSCKLFIIIESYSTFITNSFNFDVPNNASANSRFIRNKINILIIYLSGTDCRRESLRIKKKSFKMCAPDYVRPHTAFHLTKPIRTKILLILNL